MKIGIPKALYYYYFFDKWRYFFEELNIELISTNTDKKILEFGNKYANSEMCLSLKIFLGHIAYLKDKCDYILIPKIDNFGLNEQMCSNFSSLYDLVNNLFDVKILTYEINHQKKKNEKKGLFSIGLQLGFTKKQLKKAYQIACLKYNKQLKRDMMINFNKLESTKKKILIVAHSYNIHDDYIGKTIIKSLEKYNFEIIYSDLFNAKNLSHYLSLNLYWRYCKESLGAIVLCKEKVDGIIFITTFPCGLDSLVNELVMRKIQLPYLNLIIDDLDALAGIETRIESFADIIEQN